MASEQKHTVGPWKMAGQGKNKMLPITADGKIIARVSDWGTLSDARLIASAPSLLAGYEEILYRLGTQPMQDDELADLCRAKIVKARGA